LLAQMNDATNVASELFVLAEDLLQRAALRQQHLPPPRPAAETLLEMNQWRVPLPDLKSIQGAERYTHDHSANACVS
jgi:hypothetical protein